MRSKYFIFLLFSSLTLVFSQVQDSGEFEKNNQRLQEVQVDLPDSIETGQKISPSSGLPYVEIPYKPAEPLAKVASNPNNPFSSSGDQVLIIGGFDESGVDYSDRDNIKAKLEAAGHTVTITTSGSYSTYPSDVSSYDQIWDLRFVDAMSSSDQTKLKTVLQNGGTVYLTGENGHFTFLGRNNSIVSFNIKIFKKTSCNSRVSSICFFS